MELVQFTSIINSNKTYQVEKEARGCGSKKVVFFHPNNEYVIAVYKENPDQTSRFRLTDLVKKYSDGLFKTVGGNVWKEHFCWPTDIVESPNGKIGIVMPLYPESFIFQKGSMKGLEKKGNWFTKPKIKDSIDPQERGNWRNLLFCAYNLARTIRRLHAAGLCHSDLSFNNVLLNPSKGKVQIIDVDELVVPGKYPAGVLGSPGFIAPEVVMNNSIMPSQQTDLHALACLIYLYLFKRHPLLGKKVNDPDPDKDDLLSYGAKALFVEDSNDPSNKPIPEGYQPIDWSNVDKVPYTIAGPYLKPLFQKAFEEGLRNPAARPSAQEWENALWNTYERITWCSNLNCPEHFFVLNRFKRCPFCGTVLAQQVPVFDMFHSSKGQWGYMKKQVYGADKKSLHEWHFYDNIYYSEKLPKGNIATIAALQFHQGNWYFTNKKMNNLFIHDNQTVTQLAPGQNIALKPDMQLENREPNGLLLKVKFI